MNKIYESNNINPNTRNTTNISHRTFGFYESNNPNSKYESIYESNLPNMSHQNQTKQTAPFFAEKLLATALTDASTNLTGIIGGSKNVGDSF